MTSANPLAFLAIEASAVCAACRAKTPITRLAQEVPCRSCSGRVAIDWRDVLSVTLREQWVSVLELLPGLSEGDVLLGSGARSEVRVVVERPRCACGHAFVDDALAKIDFKTRAIACAACGRETSARLVRDDSIADARWVLGERDDALAVADGIVLRCGGCGAPARGDGGAEVCGFCGAKTVPAPGGPKPAAPRIHVVLSIRRGPHH